MAGRNFRFTSLSAPKFLCAMESPHDFWWQGPKRRLANIAYRSANGVPIEVDFVQTKETLYQRRYFAECAGVRIQFGSETMDDRSVPEPNCFVVLFL